MQKEFVELLKKHQTTFGLDLDEEKMRQLADYFQLIQEDNKILHLVAPCETEEFVTRHILESLTMLEFLPNFAKFADIGSGGGLPAIPCLIVQEDLTGILIESKPKKVEFLSKVLEKHDLTNRVKIVNKQFEEAKNLNVSHITCRALDKFGEKLPTILKRYKNHTFLLFGGNNLREILQKSGKPIQEKLMPLSEQRFLYVVK